MDEGIDRKAKLRRKLHEGDCFVYVAVETEGSPRYLKIGISRHCGRRFKTQTDNPRPIMIFGEVKCPTRKVARLLEAYLHQQFAPWFKRGEWFGARVDDIEAMALAVIRLARSTISAKEFFAGKTIYDFSYAEIDHTAPQWWLLACEAA